MARPKLPEGTPTPAELDILQVMWANGPATVRFINQELNKSKEVPYTSTLKIMQLMHEKGMLYRDNTEMTHIYMAKVKEAPVKKAMLKRFVDAVFKGSNAELMTHLLGNKKGSRDELDVLKELVKKMEGK